MINMDPFFIMSLQLDLEYCSDFTPHEFERFANLIDPIWVDEALSSTGTESVRRRRLPAERLVWLVIGLACFVMNSSGTSSNSLALPMVQRTARRFRVPRWRVESVLAKLL